MITVASQRVLQARAATISALFVDQDGDDTAPVGTVHVHAVRLSDGADVLAVGTVATVAGNTATAPLTAAQTATLDALTCTWTDSTGDTITTTVEVVGGYYATVAEVQALKNMAARTSAEIITARRWFEDQFEDYVGAAMVLRFRTVTVWGDGTDHLDLPNRLLRTVRSVAWGTVSLGSQALANLVAEASGKVTRYWPLLLEPTDDSLGIWSGRFPEGFRVTVAYEHGLDRPHANVKAAALEAIRDKLLTDNAGNREYARTTEIGTTVRSSMPGQARPFGIPFVDQVANWALHEYGAPTAYSVQIG